MAKWFDGSIKLDCSLAAVKASLNDVGQHTARVVRQMPGITQADVLDSGSDFVTVRTNEGVMKRTNIAARNEGKRIIVDFDEEYDARAKVHVSSHYTEEFEATGDDVALHLAVRDVEAPGFLGFMYRKLGRASIGKASLKAYQGAFKRSD